MKKMKYILIVLLGGLLGYSVVHNSDRQYQYSEGVVWATEYHITYESEKNLEDSIQKVLMMVDNSLSQFNKTSLVARINCNETEEVDSMFETVYNASRRISAETGGAFDPTCGPLVNAWGFGYKKGTLPDSADVDSIKAFVGIEKTDIKGHKVVKIDRRTSFDFSAIAKGYGCDMVGAMMQRNGVKNYMVEIGGEISLKGVNERGDPWRISVDKPIESNDSVIHQSQLVVSLDKGGVATSGNYRNYKEVGGKKVVHTINPQKGYPEISNMLSVTIIAPTCMEADAYATSCMVMGLEKTKEHFGCSDTVGAYVIMSDEKGNYIEWKNEAFKRLEIKD